MKKVRIIGVPMDLGASRRGVDMGPSALRIANVAKRVAEVGFEVTDIGNILVKGRELLTEDSPKAKYQSAIVQVLKELSDQVYKALEEKSIPLVIGGDHSIAMGTVAGMARYYKEKNKKIGVIWFDAHGDINTPETTISGNVHGMPVAHILGLGSSELQKVCPFSPMVEPGSLVLVGLRDLDPGEKVTIKKNGIHAFTMKDIDELGMREVVRQAIEIASKGTEGFHVSFDMDWIDPEYAPGVGTPVPGGANFREGHLSMELIADSGRMLSVEVTEVNPVLDNANKTADLAVDMILSAFGKGIL